MNLLHMKYALAIAETNSINKAAEKLFVGAPTISRAIKELEIRLGVSLFERSTKGMLLTPDGELFIRYVKKVLRQVDDIEALFKDGSITKTHFSISVPRASYIAEAFARFSKKIDRFSKSEIFYRETNSNHTIKNIIQEDYKLAILRYRESFDSYYQAMIKKKGLSSELITQFKYVIVMSKKSLLVKFDFITFKDLDNYIEITHANPYVPFLPVSEIKKEELSDNGHCRIFVFERASQFELLSKNHDTYMWVSSIPHDLLDRYDLVERKVEGNTQIYKDVLIHRNDYKLSALDKTFIEELVKVKRCVFGRN